MSERKEHFGFVSYDTVSAVYAIINKKKKAIYIGKSEDLNERLGQHYNALKRGKHPSKLMQKHFDWGCDFKAIILKRVEKKERNSLLMWEDFFIECARAKKIKLYNSKSVKDSAQAYFMRACLNLPECKPLLNIFKQ